MNADKFKIAQESYKEGDYRSAARGFLEATEPGTPISNGAAYHMAGNAFMRLKRYQDAITVYEHALKDDTYLRRAAVEANLANAYLKAGEYDTAISHYQAALEETDCKSPYKCYQGMGAALMEQDSFEQAAIAYRRAALDKGNPEPGKSLVNLGLCLMSMQRPKDAIEAYKAALGTESYQTPGRALSNLGIAYYEMQEWTRSIRAFEEAVALHGYKLSQSAETLLAKAREEFEASGLRAGEDEAEEATSSVDTIDLNDETFEDDFSDDAIDGVSQKIEAEPSSVVEDVNIAVLAADLVGQPTDAFTAAPAVDESGSFFDQENSCQQTAPFESVPADEDAPSNGAVMFGGEEDVENFFGRTEKEAAKLGKQKAKEERGRFGFVKWVVAVIVALVLIAGAGAAVYFTGFGIPTPKEVVSQAIEAYNTGKAFEGYWVDTTNTVREMAAVPVPAKFTIDSVDVNGMKAVVNVKVKPESGTALAFRFNIERRGMGWKISSVENEY